MVIVFVGFMIYNGYNPPDPEKAACKAVLVEEYKKSKADPNYRAPDKMPKECKGLSLREYMDLAGQVIEEEMYK